MWQWFVYGPIGATFLGHFVTLAFAARHRGDARWGRQAVVTSMLAWFCVDSAAGLLHRAYFNVALINVPSLLAVLAAVYGPPWWRRRTAQGTG